MARRRHPTHNKFLGRSLLGLSLELVEQLVLLCPVGRFDMPVDLIEEDALQC